MSSIFSEFRIKSKITLILAVLCIIYCTSAITVIVLALTLDKAYPEVFLNNRVLLAYSLISFGFAIILSIYFFFNTLGRRRRKSDKSGDTSN